MARTPVAPLDQQPEPMHRPLPLQAQQLRVFDQRLAKEHAAADVLELEAALLRTSRASPPMQQRQVSPPSPQKELPGLEQRASALLKQDVERAKRAIEHRSAVNEELARLRRT